MSNQPADLWVVFAWHWHGPAEVAVLAPTLRASGLAGCPGVVLRLDVLRLMFRQQQQSVPQTDSCKLHAGYWNGCWLALAAQTRESSQTNTYKHTQAGSSSSLNEPVMSQSLSIAVKSIHEWGRTEAKRCTLLCLFTASLTACRAWVHWPVHAILGGLGSQNDLAMVSLANDRLNNTFLTR